MEHLPNQLQQQVVIGPLALDLNQLHQEELMEVDQPELRPHRT
jgi:hypothetical protein